MYRFRKVKYLLDEKYDELNNQEIYLASAEELNDPMEGVRDIFWQGDEVLWRNFIKHYLMCLEHVISMWNVVGEEKEINKDFIMAFKNSIEFSSVKHKERFIKIEDYFFSNKIISSMPAFLAHKNRKIRYRELFKYLKVIHKFAFDSINFVNTNYGYMERINIFKNISDKYSSDGESSVRLLASTEDKEECIDDDFVLEDEIEKLFNSLNSINSEHELLNSYDNKSEQSISNEKFIIVQFPEAYLSKMEEIVHPRWYSASFMDGCRSVASWSSYGDNHRGVCLKFKTNIGENNNSQSMKLKGIIRNGVHSVIGDKEHQLVKIKYDDKLKEIDFFKSLGRMSFPKFNEQWYANENGEISSTVYNLNFDEEWLQCYRQLSSIHHSC